MNEYRILVLDDDPLIQQGMRMLLGHKNLRVDIASNGMQALQLMEKNPHQYSVVIVDYHLPDRTGAGVVSNIRRMNPNSFVLVFSGDNSRDVLKESLRAGATDFVDKQGDMVPVLNAVIAYHQKYIENHASFQLDDVENENSELLKSLGLAGRSNSMAKIARDIIHHRQHRFTVFLMGESGTGKERLARALHTGPENKFFAVNCATYRDNSTLLESEFFGYEKGAFTGAEKTKRGIFELADGGTIFLDEIHELSITAQAKLLRVLQDKIIRRVGGASEIPVNVRVVAAAKPCIEQKKESGEFLLDLYNRLYVFPIEIPPLRDRKEDIKPLVSHFAQKYCEEMGKDVRFLEGTVKCLESGTWMGNVRELENTVLRLVVNSTSNEISADQLSEITQSDTNPDEQPASLAEIRGQFESREKGLIYQALSENKFNLRATARHLDVSHTTLHSKIKKYNLNPQKEITS